MSDAEIFRAFIMSIKQGDFDFSSSIMDHLPDEKKKYFQENYLLLQSKIMAIQGKFLAKASMAIGFYNTIMSQMMQLDQDVKGVDKEYMQKKTEEVEYFQKVIENCNRESKGAVELDFVDEWLEDEPFYDYWKRLGFLSYQDTHNVGQDEKKSP